MAIGDFASGILQNLVADAIVALLGGGMLAWLKRRGSPLLGPLTYGLGGTAAIMLIMGSAYMITNPALRHADPTTPENIESRLMDWANLYHLSVRKMPESADVYFHYQWENVDRNTVHLFRRRDNPGYLEITTTTGPLPEQLQRMNKLSAQDKARLTRDVLVELLKIRVQTSLISAPFYATTFIKRLPISESLTEGSLFDALNDIDSAVKTLETVAMRDVEVMTPTK